MDITMLIDGAEAVSADKASFERLNPVTGKVATRAPAAGRADVDRAVEAAAAAFPGWAATGPNARRAILMKAADALEARTPEFIETGIAETGATGPWMGFNVFFAANLLREAAAMTTQVTGEVIPSDKPGTLAMALREPVGVLVGMAPWNAPVILGVRAVAMPLACGNTVVLKASETCPATHRLIVETLNAAGLPKGVLNIVTHSAEDAPEVVSALIAHPKVKRINFTGSTRVGRIIAEQAGRHLKPVLLELGGKAPLVVLDDADLDGAVNAAAFGAFMNQGQICMSTEKIVVDAAVADEFVGPARSQGGGAALRRPHRAGGARLLRQPCRRVERVAALIDDAVGKGAVLVTGGATDSSIMPATVVDRVTPEMRIYAEESFGPGGRGGPRRRHRAGGRRRQRQRVRPRRRGLRPRRRPGAGGGAPHRIGHRPRQRPDGAGRGADAVRRGQVQRLRPVRRQGRDRRLHRVALGQHRGRRPALSVLKQQPAIGNPPARDQQGERPR